MIFYVQFMILVVLFSAMGLIYHAYIATALGDAAKYKLYALRDRLAILAMEGKVNEKSEEYRLLIKCLHWELRSMEVDFSITKFVFAVVASQMQKENEFRRVMASIRENEHLNPIASELFYSAWRRLDKRIWTLKASIAFVFCVRKILSFIKELLGGRPGHPHSYGNSNPGLSETYDDINGYRQILRDYQVA